MLNRTICFSKGTACSHKTHRKKEKNERRKRQHINNAYHCPFQILEPKTHIHTETTTTTTTKAKHHEHFWS